MAGARRGHGGEQILGKRRGGAAAAAPSGAAAEQELDSVGEPRVDVLDS